MEVGEVKKEAVGLRLSCGGKYQDWVVPSVRQAVLDDPFLKDVVVVCKSGFVETSAVLLAAISPWLRRLMEEAGEEFCLCLPSISSDMFTEYLSTCLTPGTMDASSAVVHDLLFPAGLKIQPSQSSLNPQTKTMEILPRKETKKEETQNCISIKEEAHVLSDNEGAMDNDWDNDAPFWADNFKQTYSDLESDKEDDNDDDWEAGQVRKTNTKKRKATNDENGTEIKKRRGRPKGSKDKPKKTAEEIEEIKKRKQENRKRGIGRPKGSINAPSSWMCPECGEEFRSKAGCKKSGFSAFNTHMMHHATEKFSCDCPDAPKLRPQDIHVGAPGHAVPGQLNQSTRHGGGNFYAVERHMKLVHLDWKGCDQCEQTFKTDATLERHLKDHGEHFCDLCGYMTNSKSKLTNHKRRHDQQEVTCTECNKTCGNIQILREHINKSHKERLCEVCNKTVKNLMTHMQRMHTEDSDKSFQCPHCEKGFAAKQTLQGHIVSVHLRSRPFSCRYGCEFGYNDVSNRNSHEKKKHGKLFEDYEFSDKAILENHLDNLPGNQEIFYSPQKIGGNQPTNQNHTPTIHQPKSKTKDLINLENASFHDLNEKLESMVEYVNGKWSCTVCGKTNKDNKKKDVKRHAESHITGVSHTCNTCGRSFRSSEGLRKHKYQDHTPGVLATKSKFKGVAAESPASQHSPGPVLAASLAQPSPCPSPVPQAEMNFQPRWGLVTSGVPQWPIHGVFK